MGRHGGHPDTGSRRRSSVGADLGQPLLCPLPPLHPHRPPHAPHALLGSTPPTAAVSAEPRDSGSFDQFLALKSQLATGSGNGALQSGGVTVRSC